jgi:hypothetical protein
VRRNALDTAACLDVRRDAEVPDRGAEVVEHPGVTWIVWQVARPIGADREILERRRCDGRDQMRGVVDDPAPRSDFPEAPDVGFALEKVDGDATLNERLGDRNSGAPGTNDAIFLRSPKTQSRAPGHSRRLNWMKDSLKVVHTPVLNGHRPSQSVRRSRTKRRPKRSPADVNFRRLARCRVSG